MELHYPTELNHIKAKGIVRITWDDGHVGEYSEEYLRGYCPCALCQGHGSQRRFVSVPGAKLQEIRAVGANLIANADFDTGVAGWTPKWFSEGDDENETDIVVRGVEVDAGETVGLETDRPERESDRELERERSLPVD